MSRHRVCRSSNTKVCRPSSFSSQPTRRGLRGEYGAANAPTPQQINEAYESGQELELPGDKSTVYGRSVRKAALEIADDQITALASMGMSNLAQVFDNALNDDTMTDEKRAALAAEIGVNDFGPQSFADALDTMNAGYAAVLDENAPGVARKFRAQSAITANSKYNTYLEAYVKKNNERQQAQFLQDQETIFSVEAIRGHLMAERLGPNRKTAARKNQKIHQLPDWFRNQNLPGQHGCHAEDCRHASPDRWHFCPERPGQHHLGRTVQQAC